MNYRPVLVDQHLIRNASGHAHSAERIFSKIYESKKIEMCKRFFIDIYYFLMEVYDYAGGGGGLSDSICYLYAINMSYSIIIPCVKHLNRLKVFIYI